MEDKKKKKKFDPLASDWLMGNVAKESVEDAIKETVEILPNDNETEDEVEEVKESKKKSKKVNEDTVGFKNIFEGTTSKNVLEEDEKEIEETKED